MLSTSPAASRSEIGEGRADAPVFSSILWPDARPPGTPAPDDVLHDLALDQVLDRAAAAAPAAAEAFRILCVDETQVRYRQDVFRVLDDAALRGVVDAFLKAVDDADRRDAAAARAHAPYEGELWHLAAVVRYVHAVEALADGLDAGEAAADAEAVTRLARFVREHRASDAFAALVGGAISVQEGLRAVRSDILIRDGRITVAPTDDEPDLRAEVLDVFARFMGEDEPTSLVAPADHGLDHVQAWILERVALVHPRPFADLVRFAGGTRGYRDPTLMRFAGEVRFYLACLDHIAPLRRAGLPFCRATVSASDKALDARDTFDLALAGRLVQDGKDVVLNDIRLAGVERVLVISGPNQGGKSTTARTFGQLHHLAAIGCPVPGREVRIFLCDRVLTAFEREEELDDLEGRLGAEVERMHALLSEATPSSVLVLNEVFSSTALADARTLTRDVLDRVLALDALAACVTFIDELSRIDARTVSMVSAVDPADAALRTFRVERRVADGRAYARALAAKHGLTAQQIKDRMARQEGERP